LSGEKGAAGHRRRLAQTSSLREWRWCVPALGVTK
jgi:hypothetical protein